MKTSFLTLLSTVIASILVCSTTVYASETQTKSQLVESEKGLYISEKNTYKPDEYKNFIAFKNYSGGHTIAYFNEKFKVRHNANYNEILGKFKYKTFSSIEELTEFCENGGEGLQESSRLVITKSEEGIYAMNCNIKISESEVWQKKPYNSSKNIFGSLNSSKIAELTLKEILEILPLILGIVVGFIAIRKAMNFIINSLQKA